jgi:hypothetical protein
MCLETMVANIGWIAAGATSTGGISALVIKTFRIAKGETRKTNVTNGETNGQEQGDSDEHEDTTDRIAAGMGRCATETAGEGEGVDARP